MTIQQDQFTTIYTVLEYVRERSLLTERWLPWSVEKQRCMHHCISVTQPDMQTLTAHLQT